jgi:hypothetical protein
VVGQADEASDAEADRLAVAVAVLADRAEREVVLLIDVAQVAQLVVGERGLRREEAGVARLGRELLEARAQERLVLGRDQAQPDRRAVLEGRALDVVRAEEARG